MERPYCATDDPSVRSTHDIPSHAITLSLLVIASLMVLAGQPALAGRRTPLSDSFARAAAAHDVPRDLLVALAYAETHLDGHGGEPSASGGYGVMHLVSNPTTHIPGEGRQAHRAAGRQAAAPTTRPTSPAAPRCCAPTPTSSASTPTARKDPGRWYQAVAKYGNATTPEVARLYADTVYDLLATAVAPPTPAATVTVEPQERAARPRRPTPRPAT